MKKILISILSVLALNTVGYADNICYNFYDEDGLDMYGVLHRVSPNGKWAVGGDETDGTGCIIINTSAPDNYVCDPNGLLLDVDDNGLAVGSWYEKINYTNYLHAATYKDGVWTRLPEPEEILGRSYAVAISADSKTIVGHAMCANEAPDEPGRYFPIVWRYNESTGKYDLDRLYNNLHLPGTYGFFVQCLSPDGKIIGGSQSLDFGSEIAAMFNIETEEYTVFHDIEYREVHEIIYGEEWCWDNMFVDGLMEGFDEYTRFNGVFAYATDKYLYGSRGEAYDIQDDGSGKIKNMATVYDIENMEFIDGPDKAVYSCGSGLNVMFTNRGTVIKDGNEQSLSSLIGNTGKVDIIYGMDDSGKVLAGSRICNTGWGDMYESPVLIILDESVMSGIEDIAVDMPDASSVTVVDGVLTVEGASEVCVYTIDGTLISTAASTPLAPGVYVVSADGHSHKVMVK